MNDIPFRVITKPAPQPDDPTAAPVYERLPGPKEIAVLEVKGQFFSNWTTVRVEQKWTEAFPVFTFDCTEEVPIPLTVNGAQFVPGDVVRVLLGGAPAVFGYISERHVGFDGQQHGVRLIGCGDTADLVNSSIPLDKLNGHDGKSVEQLAKDLSAHLNIGVHLRGDVDKTPFDKIQPQPGETPMQCIERYAKMRAVLIGSEANGGLLLIGPHPATTLGWLVEGINILSANCVVRDPMIYKKIFATGQDSGSDSANGDPQNKQVAQVDGSSTRNKVLVVVADVADTMHGIQKRVEMESVFTEGSYIEAQIKVQGWFKDANASDDIWRAGEYYTVTAPSLILYDVVLGCSACAYEQADGGTTTTLTMVKPQHMNGRFNYSREAMIFAAQEKQAARDKAAAEAAMKAAPPPPPTTPVASDRLQDLRRGLFKR
jgi:prophage tail gpP-like protein